MGKISPVFRPLQFFTSQSIFSEAEWDYWYGGKPAATDITDPFGKLVEKGGRTRDGGAFWDRMGNIAAWNPVMDEDRYLTRRWNEFITS
jgi:putative spermidine/putrescine transport system substrate-binding protein